MWAQNWESLFSLLLPNASVSGEEATKVLRKRYSSFSGLAQGPVQDFFLSIGKFQVKLQITIKINITIP